MAETVLSDTPTPETEQPIERPQSVWSKIGMFFLQRREASILIIVVLLAVYFGSSARFLTSQNLPVLAQYVSATAIVAIGEVFVIITGEIDLSVGVVATLAPFIWYNLEQNGVPLVAAILIALVICGLIGVLNGVVTVIFRVPSLITTLGTQFLIGGLTLIISGDQQTPTPVYGSINNILGGANYSEFVWAFVLIIIFQIVLFFTRWGTYTVAAGGNLLGASEAGVPVNRIKIANFVLAAVLSGLAGTLQVFAYQTIDPLANGDGGTTLMFAAVAGAVIGGTVLTGGSGTVIGAFLGCLAVSIVQNGLILMGVNQNLFTVVLGIAILIAMIINVAITRWREVRK